MTDVINQKSCQLFLEIKSISSTILIFICLFFNQINDYILKEFEFAQKLDIWQFVAFRPLKQPPPL